MRFLPSILGLLTLVSASPIVSRDNASSTSTSQPKVTIYPKTSSGNPVEIDGVRYQDFGQDVYLGVPFAAPPVGDLRFAPPQPPTWNATTLSAQVQKPGCLQPNSSDADPRYGFSEDCLYLNVYTPEGIDPSQQSLPVMVWVYGGSFDTGSANDYNASFIMLQAMTSQKPVIFVTVNYRLGLLGFPGGKQAADAGSANLGLKDVIASVEWIQENIWAFGGDSGSVTLYGESAGAILISDLFLQPNISTFKAAVMESGGQSNTPLAPTSEFWQEPFDAILNFTNCASKPDQAIDCLRNVSSEDLLKAQLAVMNETQYSSAFVFAPSIDGDTIPDSPHKLLSEGKFAKKPFISGSNVDEGTLFTPTTGLENENSSAIPEILASLQPKPASLDKYAPLLELYPSDPADGSPYNTGNNTFGQPPLFKQLAAVLGDGPFQSSRRWFLKSANDAGWGQTWSYLFAAPTPGAEPYLGIAHASEIPFVFGEPQLVQEGNAPNGTAPYTKQDRLLSTTMMNYWINMAYYSDPNGNLTNNDPSWWPCYGQEKNMLQLNVSETGANLTVIADTYRQKQMDFFLDNPTIFNL